MTTYLFGVLPEPEPGTIEAPPADVRAIATEAGVAWVRTASTVDAREHHHVLAVALGTGRTPVPARVGTHFRDDDALRDALARTAGVWRASLARVRDRVEMLIFVPLDAETPARERDTDARSGREYLERLRRRIGGDDATRASLRRAVGGLASDDAAVTHPSGRGTLVSHLVRRADVDAYRAAVDAWRATSDAATMRHVVVLGPWPPFSFADGALESAA